MKDWKAIIAGTQLTQKVVLGVTQQILVKDGNTVNKRV